MNAPHLNTRHTNAPHMKRATPPQPEEAATPRTANYPPPAPYLANTSVVGEAVSRNVTSSNPLPRSHSR